MHPKTFALSAALAASCLASTALAGQSWLAASDWEPRPGEQVTITSHAGTGFQGDGAAFTRGDGQRLIIRQASTSERPEWAGRLGATLDVSDDDGTLIASESIGSVRVVPGGAFDDYLRDEGLDVPLSMRMASGASAEARSARERVVTCDKTWLAGSDGRRVREPAGLTLELVPRKDPSRVSRVKIQLLYKGKPVSNALVTSWRQPLENDGSPTDPAGRFGLPPIDRQRTDRLGMIRLDVAPRGEYLVSASHSRPCRDPHVADWDTWQASLTFARGADRPWEGTDQPKTVRGVGLGTNPDLGDPGFGWSTTVRDWPGWSKR